MKYIPKLSVLIFGTLLAAPVTASDHLDGPATSDHPVADLSDLYAFPTPERPGSLTLILDMYPLVAAEGHFSDKVDYAFYLRRATVRSGDHPGFDTSDEVAIRCTFVTPLDDGAHHATCKTDQGVGATVAYNRVQPPAEGEGVHLFAGQRSDPFFFNAVFATAFSAKAKLLRPRNQNIMKGGNTLTVVLDVEVAKLFPNNPPSLIALAAASSTQDSPADPVRRLDRIGRPEISNIALSAHNGETDLHDQYNADPSHWVPADHADTYRERVATNLFFFDRADKHIDWTDTDRLALANLLVDDFLVVDLSKPCDRPAYFEIERSLLTHTPHQTCGGRRPDEDVMDVMFGLLAGGLRGQSVRDGADHPSQPSSSQFPYLAPPNTSASSRAKTRVLGRSSGTSEPTHGH